MDVGSHHYFYTEVTSQRDSSSAGYPEQNYVFGLPNHGFENTAQGSEGTEQNWNKANMLI